jgi:hypothetical protein
VHSDRATRFLWRAVGNADRYQIVVVDTTGTDVRRETRDTTALTLPDSVRLVPGRAYLVGSGASQRRPVDRDGRDSASGGDAEIVRAPLRASRV